jgi:hypothetical protein
LQHGVSDRHEFAKFVAFFFAFGHQLDPHRGAFLAKLPPMSFLVHLVAWMVAEWTHWGLNPGPPAC